MNPLRRIQLKWTADLAYAIGLLATDGCLSKDGRHLSLCSKDKEIITTFCRCLQIHNKISNKVSTYTGRNDYYQVQFGDVQFYNFLLKHGLHPAKSKTLGKVNVPEDYFTDFLRGCIDGDGNISITKHPESQHPQLRIRLASASKPFLDWIHEKLPKLVAVSGGSVHHYTQSQAWYLAYGKSDSLLLLNYMYYPGVKSFLTRKHVIAQPFLRM